MVLSICIPSYNRFEHLQEILDSVLRSQSKEFDVVITDNCSPKDIREVIKCTDERVRIIKREIGVTGPTNAALALDGADGEFALLCLDKDFIVGEKLDGFIELLKKNDNVACGYCRLNSTGTNEEFDISDALEDNLFQGRHPSGMFFRTKYIRGESSAMELTNPASPYYSNPFLIDLLYAKSLCKGKQACFGAELIKTETPEQAAKQRSYTYSEKKGNLYFAPDNRIKQFWVYILRTQELHLPEDQYKRLVQRLVERTMWDVSLNYKWIMGNRQLCLHHGMEIQQVSKREQWRQVQRFTKSLWEKKIARIKQGDLRTIILKCKLKTLIKIMIKG